MPKLVNATPSYRRHQSGQAVVTLDGRDHYLGPHGSVASRREYDRLVALWLAGGRRMPGRRSDDVTVSDLLLAFWTHAQVYHLAASGHRGELEHYRSALKRLKKLNGPDRVADFGPLALKAVRQVMVDEGWSRNYVNAQVARLKRVFKWGTENELVAGGVFQALEVVAGLREGKSEARETEPVEAVDPAAVEAVAAIVAPPLAAMIRLQVLTGMRPGEVCQMRLADVDRSDEQLWEYTPATHKTKHLKHRRTVYLGEQCRAVLAPFLDRKPDAHLFSPIEADAWVRGRRAEERKTPASCGNRPGSNRRARPKKTPGDRYDARSYHRVVRDACDRAFPPPPPLGPAAGETRARWTARLTPEQLAELKAWRKAHRWHPHQIRHTYATESRARNGLEATQVLLGHKTLTVTQVYAAKNVTAAKAVMRREG